MAWNLIALCETFTGGDNCHDSVHAGCILREDLLAIVAQREGVLQADIRERIDMLRRITPREYAAMREEGTL